MATGSGEEVSSDFIRATRRTSSDVLARRLRQGISDQRAAFIRQTLAERRAGVAPQREREALRRFEEKRSLTTVQDVNLIRRLRTLEPQRSQADIRREVLRSREQSEARQVFETAGRRGTTPRKIPVAVVRDVPTPQTRTELERRQSLPVGTRGRPATEVEQRQTLRSDRKIPTRTEFETRRFIDDAGVERTVRVPVQVEERQGFFTFEGQAQRGRAVSQTPETKFLLLGAAATPARIVSAVPRLAQTQLIATIQRTGTGSRINVLGEITKPGTKSVFSAGEIFVRPTGSQSLGIGRGFTFQVQRGVRFPLGRVTKVKNIQPFGVASRAEQLGTASAVRDFGFVKPSVQIGKGSLVRSRTLTRQGIDSNILGLVSRGVKGDQPFTALAGGTPRLRIARRSGDLSVVIRDINVRGSLFEVPSGGTGVKFLQPASIKKTPLSLTFQEQQAVSNIVGSVSKSGEKALKLPKLSRGNGITNVLPRITGGVVSQQSAGNTLGSASDFQRDFSTGLSPSKDIAKQTSAQRPTQRLTPTGSVIQEQPPRVQQRSRSAVAPKQKDFAAQLPKFSQRPAEKQRNIPIQIISPIQTQPPRTSQRSRLKSPRPRPPKVPRVPRPSRTPSRGPPIIPILFPPLRKSQREESSGKFSVSIRRRGIFRPIGTGLSLRKAFELGTRRTGRTLARTFKIPGFTGGKVPTGFRRGKQSGTFVELPKFSLSTGSEVREIQGARRRRGSPFVI